MDRGHIECVKAILAYPNFLGLSGLKPALDISRGNQFVEITNVLEQACERCENKGGVAWVWLEKKSVFPYRIDCWRGIL